MPPLGHLGRPGESRRENVATNAERSEMDDLCAARSAVDHDATRLHAFCQPMEGERRAQPRGQVVMSCDGVGLVGVDVVNLR